MINGHNYRGISLLIVMSKLFTKVLNNRLVSWCEDMDMIYEGQCGFRKNRSTMENIFVLQTLVQKYLSRPRARFYCIYIDFSKAFDSVTHKYLWHCLQSSGIHDQMLAVLKSMYGQLKSCVRTPKGLTQLFDCWVGTRQGCMISPMLFVLFINQYISELGQLQCEGIYVSEDCPNLLTLMFADDIVNFADSVGRLQKQINALSQFCKRWGMKVNMEKTKVMVFRNGGPLRQNEQWFFGREKLETTSYYKYLGLIVSSRMVWSKATKTLALQAGKGTLLMKMFQKRYGRLSYKISFDLFDKMITPILMYGSEIWGFQAVKSIELVQVQFCKYFLGVSQQTANMIALGECGRLPLWVKYMSRGPLLLLSLNS